MTRKYSEARRRLLQRSLGTALFGTGMASMGGKMDLIGSALAATGDYSNLGDFKALVCVFLYGGSDSNNMFVPLDSTLYNNYATARGSLAITQDELHASADGTVGFHNNFEDMRNYYDSGQLAIMANVGNLIEPITRQQFINGGAMIPDLFGHNTQQEAIMKSYSSLPRSLVAAGWGGRMADLLQSANRTTLPPTLSMDGANLFLPGLSSSPVAVNPRTGPRSIGSLDDRTGRRYSRRQETLDRILALPKDGPLQQFAANSLQRARSSSAQLRAVLNNSPDIATSYDRGSDLGRQLRMVARLIAGREELGMQRQIFFVGMGGWDTHDNQTLQLNRLTKELNRGLFDFQETMSELGVSDQVTTFTSSEFGRTLTVNGDGSDHGWSGHYMVMGGAVNGGQLIGGWPDYQVGGPEDISDKGRMIPRMSMNQFGASNSGMGCFCEVKGCLK